MNATLSSNEEARLAWLALILTPGMGPTRAARAVQRLGGAERVLGEILKCYPNADLFSLFNILSDADLAKLGAGTVKTSFLQKMPFIRTHHRAYLPLMPFAHAIRLAVGLGVTGRATNPHAPKALLVH